MRRHTLVNGLSEAGAGAVTGCRTNNLWLGYGPHLIHRPPVVRTYKALQLTANPLRGLSAAELGRYVSQRKYVPTLTEGAERFIVRITLPC